MTLRYLILSPAEEARRRLMEELFGSAIERNPRGEGERVVIRIDDNQLEVLGLGHRSRQLDLVKKLVTNRVPFEAVLALVPSQDEETWQETRDIITWLGTEAPGVPVRTWVFGDLPDINRVKAKKEMVALLNEQIKLLTA